MKDARLARPLRMMLKHVFGIREGESRRCLGMFSSLLLLIAAMMIVKPVSTALFLSRFTARHLPFAYILTALLATALFAGYSGWFRRYPLVKLMRVTLGASISLLILFWGVIPLHWASGAFLYLFLVSVSLMTLILASQFWMAAGQIFNVREAKRLFGPIGSGAIIGGITGGYLTKFLAPVMGSHHLILPAVLCLCLSLFIMEKMWQAHGMPQRFSPAAREVIPTPSDGGSVVSQILRSPQLRLMAAILALSVMAARLVDYQFSFIVAEAIPDKDQLASFLGFWTSNLNLISLLIQMLATRRIIQRLGVGASLFFLPSGILAGALATLVHPALWSAVMIRLGEGCFKNSVNKSAMELLFLPVPQAMKGQAKAFIDIFVDAAAGGLGGILLAVLVYGLGLAPAYVSLVLFVLILVWFFLILRVRRAYIRSFREKLVPGREGEDGRLGPVPEDAQVMARIRAAMESSDEKQILRMLKITQGVYNPNLDKSLVPLLGHNSPEIRAAALSQLYFSKKTDVSASARVLVRSGHIPLMAEAVRYLFHRSNDPLTCLGAFLADPDEKVQGAALLCLVREATRNRRLRAAFDPEQMVVSRLMAANTLADRDRASFVKKICAEAISTGDLFALHSYLYLLMEDPDPGVVTAAVAAAGETRDPEFIRVLLTFLGRRTAYKAAAVTALACYGEQILGLLEQGLTNPYLGYVIRRHIPEVIAASGGQRAVDILSGQLMQPDLGLRYEIIRALNRLRRAHPDLIFDKSFISPKIKKEAGDYMDLLTILYAQKRLEPERTPATPLARAREQLIRGLETRLDANLERVFRLLGLNYPPVEMYTAYKDIRSTDKERRLNALEFLDNLLDMDVKGIIMPVVEAGGAREEGAVAAAGDYLDPGESYIALLRGQDDYLKLKTLNLIGCQPLDRYIPHVAELLNSPSRGVRNLARTVLKKNGRFSLSRPPRSGKSNYR